MSNLQTAWSEAELLASDPVAEPLVAAGRRCHGGFDASGRYRSPRTRFRTTAIAAWQDQHRADFGTDLLDVPLATWPASYPSVAQAKHLVAAGVPGPVTTILTRIGTVEGFGGLIRDVGVADRQRFFVESIAGTALEHLDRGLFEAHARDEVGWAEEAGHRDMWFAARDIAFEAPPSPDQTEEMMARMGIPAPGRGATDPSASERARAPQVFEQLDLGLELLIQRMIGLVLIEISAFHIFAWAEAVLSDRELVAGDGEAARIVSYIRQDETPHVEYLKTALSEMRDRTFVTAAGGALAGTEVIGTLWDRGLAASLGPNRAENRARAVREVEHALTGHPRAADLLAEYHALEERPDRDEASR
jgi:hypothetical protein